MGWASRFLIEAVVDVSASIAADFLTDGDFDLGESFQRNLLSSLLGSAIGEGAGTALKWGGALLRGFRNGGMDGAMQALSRQLDDAVASLRHPFRRADTDLPLRGGDSSSRCPAPKHSFSEDILVATTDGDKPISEVEVGDVVYAYDPDTGEVVEREVTHTWQHTDETIITLTIDGDIIETTPWHPFYTDEGWQEAEDLTIGGCLLSRQSGPRLKRWSV